MTKAQMIKVIAKAYFPAHYNDQSTVMGNWRNEMYKQNTLSQMQGLYEIALRIIKERALCV